MATNVIEMSVADWCALKDNPRQRNTERRANQAEHLRSYQPIHRYVWAATHNGDPLCKLDGHTRALLWEKGLLDQPPEGTVCVLLIPVKGLAEAKAYYDMLDNAGVSKKPADTIFGATRENKFLLTSALLRGCSFSVAIKLAHSGGKYKGDLHALVRNFRDELVELDSWRLSSNYTVLISVMLLAIRHGNVTKAKAFFTKLDNNEGVKTSDGMDAVQALYQHMERRRAMGTTAGWDNLYDIAARAYAAYEIFAKNGHLHKNAGLKESHTFLNFFRSKKAATTTNKTTTKGN